MRIYDGVDDGLCSALIEYELEDDEKQLEARMQRWSEAQLRSEGVTLFGLVGQITVRTGYSVVHERR